MSSIDRKVQRRAARRTGGKPLEGMAIRTLEAFGAATDVTRLFDEQKPCPHCRVKLETTHSVEDEPAGPGAFIVCMKCGGAAQLDAEMKLRLVTDDEVETLPAEGRTILRDLQALIRHAKLSRGRRTTKVEA